MPPPPARQNAVSFPPMHAIVDVFDGEGRVWKGKVCKIVDGAGTYHVVELHGDYNTQPRVGTFGLVRHRWELSNESETIVIPTKKKKRKTKANEPEPPKKKARASRTASSKSASKKSDSSSLPKPVAVLPTN